MYCTNNDILYILNYSSFLTAKFDSLNTLSALFYYTGYVWVQRGTAEKFVKKKQVKNEVTQRDRLVTNPCNFQLACTSSSWWAINFNPVYTGGHLCTWCPYFLKIPLHKHWFFCVFPHNFPFAKNYSVLRGSLWIWWAIFCLLKVLLLKSKFGFFSFFCQKHNFLFLKVMATFSKVEGCAFRFPPFSLKANLCQCNEKHILYTTQE